MCVCDHGLTRGCEPRLTVPPPAGRAKLRRSWLKVSSLHHRTMMIPWCCECCDRDEEEEEVLGPVLGLGLGLLKEKQKNELESK